MMHEELIDFISNKLLNGRITVGDDDNLLMDGMVDSLGMLQLVRFIEERLDTQIPYEDLTIENFRTVGIISAYLGQRFPQNRSVSE